MLYCFVKTAAFVLCKILFRLSIRGSENLPKKEGFILASNHNSFLDPILLAASSRRRVSFMAKEELFSNFFFGRFISSLGAFPINRDAPGPGAIRAAIKRLKRHSGLVLFPQGTRQRSEDLSPLPGVGFLAQNAGVSVVPAYIHGSDKAWPAQAKFIRLHKISVSFGKPLTIEGHTSYKEFSHRVMNAVERLEQEYKA